MSNDTMPAADRGSGSSEGLGGMSPREQMLAKALREAQAFIDGVRSDLHHLRATDWFPEGANNAALSMSENMRLIGNACADFDTIGAALAELESSAESLPLNAM